MEKYVVSENTEIILNGKRFLLEKGDTILVEGRILTNIPEGILKSVAEDIIEQNPGIIGEIRSLIEEYGLNEEWWFYLEEKEIDRINQQIKSGLQNMDVKFRKSDVNLVWDVIGYKVDDLPKDQWRQRVETGRERVTSDGESPEEVTERLKRERESIKNIFN